MAISYTFGSTVEGWTLGGFPTDPATLSWDSGTGSPDNGSLKIVMPDIAGSAEGPFNSIEYVSSPGFLDQISYPGDNFSFRYRINNTGTTRTFTITGSVIDSGGYSSVDTQTNLSGDSGWVTVSDTFSAETSNYIVYRVQVSAEGYDGYFTFWVDTATADSKLVALTNSQSAIPGAILVT